MQLLPSTAVTVKVPAFKFEIVGPVVPLDQVYVKPPVPPFPIAVAEASFAPLQLIFVGKIFILIALGSVTLTDCTSVQLVASVAVTV